MKIRDQKERHVRVTATEINKIKTRKKVLSLLVAAGMTLLIMMYMIAAIYKETGSFTININKYEMVEYGLSLSETADLSHPTSVLNAKINHSITNIAGEEIPDNVDNIDGEHNGKNYIAYTFYLVNAGETNKVSYQWQVKMNNITNDIDEAVRLTLYIDGVPTTYAKTASDGSGPEPGTTEFYSSDVLALGRRDNFTSGSTTKFTIVLWLEGTDPDCVDWIKGGSMRLEMFIEIVH